MQTFKKELKKIGFTLKVKSYSHGKNAIYFLDGKQEPDIFTGDDLVKWKPLLDFKKNINKERKIELKELKISGLF